MIRVIAMALAFWLAGTAAFSQNLSDASRAFERGDYEVAFNITLPFAERGDAGAQNFIGQMYTNGLGVARNDQEAVRWYRLAARQGHASAQAILGLSYRYGVGTTRDDKEALRWFRLAAEQGHANAQYNLGVMYQFGMGVSQDDKESLRWYRLAADQGDENAQEALDRLAETQQTDSVQTQTETGKAQSDAYTAGVAAYNRGDYSAAFASVIPGATLGDANSQYLVGLLFEKGDGVPQDGETAAVWYRKAADQGEARAQLALGTMYGLGNGVRKDRDEAVRWVRMAADQGLAAAQANLGMRYQMGTHLARDYERAARLYRLAADQGWAGGQYLLAGLYERGKGVEQDDAEALRLYKLAAAQGFEDAQTALDRLTQASRTTANASNPPAQDKRSEAYAKAVAAQARGETSVAVQWLLKAADLGHVTAQFDLGVAYQQGLGVDRNIHISKGWYRRAAEGGNKFAQVQLAAIYLTDRSSSSQDYAEAERLLLLAADQGYDEAQNALGHMYAAGLGTPRDVQQAERWFQMAADQGHEEAAVNLAELRDDMQNGSVAVDESSFDAELFLDCDEFAAHPYDINGPSDGEWGVKFSDIDPAVAIPACQRAVTDYPNISRFKYQLGRAYDKAGEFDLSLKWYKAAAEMGHAQAYSAIAYLYVFGDGVPKDLSKAIRLHEHAAELGSPGSMHDLGTYYKSGVGVEQNTDVALSYFLRASEKGYVPSYQDTAILLEEHRRDFEAAREWYQYAADEGYPLSKLRVAIYYAVGKGGPVSPQDAAFYMIDAARTGDEGVMKTLMDRDNRWGADIVSELQRQLARQGYYNGSIDGKFGPMTRRALKDVAGL